MKTAISTVTLVLMQMMTAPAFAQSSGEADPAQGKAPPSARTTLQERSSARSARKVQGADAARGPQLGEGPGKPAARPALAAGDRKDAAARRRAVNSAANKAGQFSRGGNGDAPEKQKR